MGNNEVSGFRQNLNIPSSISRSLNCKDKETQIDIDLYKTIFVNASSSNVAGITDM